MSCDNEELLSYYYKNSEMETGDVNSLSSLLSIQEVEERIRQLVAENSNLRNALQQNNTYMKQLSVSLIEWQEEVVRVQKLHSLKFEKSRELIHQLRDENSELKQKLQPLSNDNPVRLPKFLLNEKNDVQEQEIPNLVPTLISQESMSSFNLVEASSRIESASYLEPENSFLIVQEPGETAKNTNKLMKTEKDLEQESKTEKLLQINDKLMQNITELEEKVSSANTRLIKAEEITLKKQSRNTELEIKISQLEKQLETIPILTTQIELYKTDFEAERDARQNLAGEKDTMAQEIRLLKRKLADAGHVAAAPAASVAAAPVREPASPHKQENNVESYDCPKCSFNYSSVDSLNNHLDVCLNQHMFP